MSRIETIGNCTLYLGDCREILPTLGKVDAVVTDPPYSERTHSGHDTGASPGVDGAARKSLGYSALSPDQAVELAGLLHSACSGWVCWMTDHTLARDIMPELERLGRYVFAPLPFFAPGSRVRLSGDGPSSWTDWIIVSRTKAQRSWGTLPGGYVSGPGWDDKVHMGGKPTALKQCLVRDYSRYGQTVCDPFMGSGTTGVACVKLGRKFIGIEIDPKYFDIACRRIEEAYKQPDLFVQPPSTKQEQTELAL